MSFFSKLFGRSKSLEEEALDDEAALQEQPAPEPAPKTNGAGGISEERAREIEARARKSLHQSEQPTVLDTPPLNRSAQPAAQTRPATPPPPPPPDVSDLSTPSGNAGVPAANRPTAGLFKKRSKSKLQPLPRSDSGGSPPAKPMVEAKATGTPLPSNRPQPAPNKKEGQPAKKEGDGGVLEDLLGSLDESFDAIIAEQPDTPPPPGPGDEPNTDDFDRLTVLELFYDIATNHLRPVRNFMIELHLGEVRKEWIQIAQPAVRSIQSAADQIDIPELKQALDDFDAMLSIATETSGDMISGEVREEFINQYARLAKIMPQAFTLEEEKDQRESLIIHSLLMQVPDVRKVTIDKLYRAGLTALEVLFLATTEDLAVTTGIRKILAQRIVDKFQSFRKESKEAVPDLEQSAQTNKLEEQVTLLREQQTQYEAAAAKRSIEEKRAHRLARQGTLLEITVVLAQLGEVELVEELERLPFEKRIERLESFLVEQKEKKG